MSAPLCLVWCRNYIKFFFNFSMEMEANMKIIVRGNKRNMFVYACNVYGGESACDPRCDSYCYDCGYNSSCVKRA